MHRNVRSTAGRSSVSKHTRRYGPHKISYKVLEEIKYYRECYLRVYKEDICDLEPFCLYKKFLEDESLFGKVNTDDEDDADDDDLAGEIHLKHVDLRIKQNAFDHHTDMFKCTSKRVYQGKDQPAALVIRRGQIFTIELNFDREYDATKHDLQLRFQTGLDPSHLRGTDVTIDMDEDGNKFTKSNNWQARVASAMPAQVLKIEVYPATKCPIGEWDMHVYTISKEKRGGEEKKLHYKHDEDIFILFNAWCKEDEVYFEVDPDFDTEVDPKKEYVLNPSGTVYRSGMWPKAWRFGQFEEEILQICLLLVTRYFDGVVNSKMGLAWEVARAISSMVNKVLVGRWDGEYDDGSTPGSWSGSVKILHQFRDKKMAVKYGQCWVFSGVTVTVCRALGIPCRSVTNYSSAHDTNFNCSIDRVTAFGEDDYMSKDGDSIWNFHVWNEIWTKRPDLQSSELDGWQVIDATPQELSGGVYQCGPCPVKAVKHGLIYLPHDTVFVFGEVNCDVIYFEQRGQHTFKRMRTERDSVGKNISTKKPDGLGLTQDKIQQWLQRLDVTPLYKSKEKSADERLAVARAMRYAGNEIEEEAQEIDITIRPKKAETEMYLGADIPFVVYVKNVCEDKTNKLRISRLTVNLSSINYTGHKRNRVMKKEFSEFALNPDEERSFDVVVPWSDYKDKRKDSSDVSISAVATCLKSGNTFMENAVITLRNPEILEIKVKQGITKCKVDEDVELSISMKNVMPMQIGGIVVKFDTECFEDPDDIKIGTIGIDESFERTLKLKALRKGNGQIIVCVDSNNMPDMTDVVDIEVDDK